MAGQWKILVVDDEPDIHNITKIALKTKHWKAKGFELVSVFSKAEAITFIEEGNQFQVAIVDVVMETPEAGLELCDYIRTNCIKSTRIILRTGQPGVIPKEKVLSDYDIDYYLTKTDVTPDSLYAVLRACLRSYDDISTILTFSEQLLNYTKALKKAAKIDDLLLLMEQGLNFLKLKYDINLLFFPNIAKSDVAVGNDTDGVIQSSLDFNKIKKFLTHHASESIINPSENKNYNLPENSLLMGYEVTGQNIQTHLDEKIFGCIIVLFDAPPSEKNINELCSDLRVFMENWRISYGTLLLQETISFQKMLNEKTYMEKIETIASMVSGIAHEVNTPIGVAKTSSSMILDLATSMIVPDISPEELERHAVDMKECCDLLSRNIDRAAALISSFKQVSASQLYDELVDTNLVEVLADSIHLMEPELKKSKINIKMHYNNIENYDWRGFPGHLSQVMINLIQNTIRYGYPEKNGGTIDVFLIDEHNTDYFDIIYQDKGVGMDEEVSSKVFHPFFTTGRGKGGTGLGMAISQNIMVNLLKGDITCSSQLGEGTEFFLRISKKLNPVPAENK